ncbi:Conserved_hypothetical protein [Hexamita inflata]|uniref:Uncharacterized protein n=1 Tax=Hexamita inflata TaxID=28002 RepID=A0AA86Q1T2_9EUKA|nr:Conserved hypothetical protein [Hexamita inflata]
MFNIKCLFDYQAPGQLSIPPYNYTEVSMNDPNRLLVQHEIKQTANNQCICDMVLSEQELDFKRASKVINYINQLYPFLSSKIVYDEKAKWMRYEQQEIFTFDIKEYAEEINSLDQLGDYISNSYLKLSDDKLSNWEILRLNIDEFKNVKTALAIQMYHTLIDGGAAMMLFKKFNILYSDMSIDLDVKPEPVQLSNFRSIMAYDSKLNLKQVPELKNKRNFQLSKYSNQSTAKRNEQYAVVVRHYHESQICRIPNVQYSVSLYTVQMAQYVGYLYFNKDLNLDQPFVTICGDIRRNVEVHENGIIPNLDLSNTIIGQTATTTGFISKGSLHTSLSDISAQFQVQFKNYKQTDENFWQKVIDNEAPVNHFQFLENGQPCSTFTSNMGKMDLAEGPMVHFLGSQTFANVYQSTPTVFSSCFCRGKFGIFITEIDFKIFNKRQQNAMNQVYIAINKKVIEKGAENVSIQDVVDIYTQIWE